MKKFMVNSDLAVEQLPAPGDRNAVFAFAMSFDGYEHFGSFEAAAENARARSRATLTDVRNELFMQARASRHRDDDKFLDTYQELLPCLKRLIQMEKKPNNGLEPTR